ncbi:hypothetical protein FIU56_09245 [Enterococcus faecium]|nr:hypothetical protein FIU56_09245 [Enterococcus faecium]
MVHSDSDLILHNSSVLIDKEPLIFVPDTFYFFIILYYPLLVFLLLKKQNFIGFFLTILNWFLQTL